MHIKLEDTYEHLIDQTVTRIRLVLPLKRRDINGKMNIQACKLLHGALWVLFLKKISDIMNKFSAFSDIENIENIKTQFLYPVSI